MAKNIKEVSLDERPSDKASTGEEVKPRANRFRRRGRGRGPRNAPSGDPAQGPAEDGNARGPARRPPRQTKPFVRLTHFLSIPLNSPAIQERFQTFKTEVLSKFGETEKAFIKEDLFQNPVKIHLTFGVMTLTEEQETIAKNLLKKFNDEVVKEILTSQPLSVQIKGLDVIQDRRRPRDTRVLYAKVTTGAEKLQAIADQLVAAFIEKGLMTREYDSVRIHVTLMNVAFRDRQFRRAKYARDPALEPLKRLPSRFDAKLILEEFKDFVFAEELIIDDLHISSFMKHGEDGYYAPLLKVKLGA